MAAEPLELEMARHSAHIDPALHIWGWQIPTYLFLGGLAAGVLILGSILALRMPHRSRTLRWVAFAPVVLLSLGMGALLLDLELKRHVARFYLALRWTSPMSWGAWILVAVYPVSLLAALSGLEEAEAARLGNVAVRLRAWALPRFASLCRANIAAGALLGIYTGVLLSTLGARPLWSSALLGPLFLVSGVSTGAAFLLLFRLADGERHLASRWELALIPLEAALLALFLAGLWTSGAAGKAAATLLLGGAWTAPFWTLVVLAGLAIPWTLEALESRLHLRPTSATAALVLLGGFSLRVVLVAAGQHS